jgi:hypothetical protein
VSDGGTAQGRVWRIGRDVRGLPPRTITIIDSSI